MHYIIKLIKALNHIESFLIAIFNRAILTNISVMYVSEKESENWRPVEIIKIVFVTFLNDRNDHSGFIFNC